MQNQLLTFFFLLTSVQDCLLAQTKLLQIGGKLKRKVSFSQLSVHPSDLGVASLRSGGCLTVLPQGSSAWHWEKLAVGDLLEDSRAEPIHPFFSPTDTYISDFSILWASL